MGRLDVFISATSADLSSYREVAKQALLDIGAHPVEQGNFPTDHRELNEMLARQLDPCDAVLHIAGFRYGGEPRPEPNIPRHSYTQWEYHRAISAQPPKQVYVFVARENCPFDPSPPESEENRILQLKHRDEIKSRKNIYHEFSSHEELRERIHRIPELRSPARGRVINIPFPPLGNRFTGRVKILNTLRRELAGRKKSVLTTPSALYADGGIGKTSVAVELGWELFDTRQFDFVFFLNASTPETLSSSLGNLAATTALNLPEKTASEQNARQDAVFRWLSEPTNAERTLLLIDAADSEQSRNLVLSSLPQLARCAVLITSRFDSWSTLRSHRLQLFTQKESRRFLRTRIDPKYLTHPDSDKVLDAISTALDRLPLALELATSYMKYSHQSPSEWLQEWNASPQKTLTHLDRSHTPYPLALARVWDRSVSTLSPFALNLLCTMSWFAPEPDTFPLEQLMSAPDWPKFRDGFAELTRASLIKWEQSEKAISIHRLLQIVTRHRLSIEARNSSLDAALASLINLCPHPDWNEYGWRLWPKLLPHLLGVFEHLKGRQSERSATAYMQACALWLKHQARYIEAEPLYRRSLTLDEEALGPNHPHVLLEMNNLGRLLDCLDRDAEAETLLRKAVAVAKASDQGSPDVLTTCLLTLAQVIRAEERDSEKQDILKQIISLNEHGTTSPITFASALVDLAGIEVATERKDAAEAHYRQALSLFNAHLDATHPHIARTLDPLGQLLIARGEMEEAKILLQRALSIEQKCYGNAHPHLASTLQSLGLWYVHSKRLVEAEAYLRRALACTRSGGVSPGTVARILSNLAMVLWIGGRLGEAEQLAREALAITERICGPDAALTAARLDNLAAILRSGKALEEAEILCARRLKILLRLSTKSGRQDKTLDDGVRSYLGCLYEKGLAISKIQERMDQLTSDIQKETGSQLVRRIQVTGVSENSGS